MKYDFRSEGFKRRFSIILFVDNLIIKCSILNREYDLKKAARTKE